MLLRIFGTRNLAATAMQWTPLHCASTVGCSASAALLIAARCDVEAKDARGHGALLIAAARGHEKLLGDVISAGAEVNVEDKSGMTAMHLAAMRGDAVTVRTLAEAGAVLDASKAPKGFTPLLLACLNVQGWSAVPTLLKLSADPNAQCHGTKKSALMLLVEAKFSSAELPTALQLLHALLEAAADPEHVDSFGQTVLHIACRKAPAEIIAYLCQRGARPQAQDNDGMMPVQLLCQRGSKLEEEADLVFGLKAMAEADPQIARRADFGDATPLHILCQYIEMECLDHAPLKLLEGLLELGADIAAEEEGGWTAAHYLHAAAQKEKSQAAQQALLALQSSQYVDASFWASWDQNKPRVGGNAKYLARRGGHHRIPPADRWDVLQGNLTMSGVAARLQQGRSRKVVVLLGAGASTACGIPDFRSPNGLWSDAATRELFSVAGFIEKPEVFWRKKGEVFLDRKPSRAHELIADFAKHGLLQRVYTQNIDGLELDAGVPEDLVIHCHGNIKHAVCLEDASHGSVPSEPIMKAAACVPCWKAPRCHVCQSLLRPNLVFFGEPMPASYNQNWGDDLAACDLLLVMGTSLNVYPVAGLVKQVKPLVPRLLINRERVGHWRDSGTPSENYRDVCWEGDCDEGAEELRKLLGWS